MSTCTEVRDYFVFHDGEETDFVRACISVCEKAGLRRARDPNCSAFAIGPRLTRILSQEEYSAPHFGTLIFHPSALPYGRGPEAIRWTVARRERVSAATWFFAEAGIDSGPICVQELVVLARGESAGRAYHTRFVPAGIRALERAIAGYVSAGRFMRRVQDESLATYDPGMTKGATPCYSAIESCCNSTASMIEVDGCQRR